MTSEYQIPVRAPEVVLDDVEKAYSILYEEGVYTFLGNKDNASLL